MGRKEEKIGSERKERKENSEGSKTQAIVIIEKSVFVQKVVEIATSRTKTSDHST